MIWKVYGKRRGGIEEYLGTVGTVGNENIEDARINAWMGFPLYIITNLEEVSK